jgi:hypothetical protein
MKILSTTLLQVGIRLQQVSIRLQQVSIRAPGVSLIAKRFLNVKMHRDPPEKKKAARRRL